jgi:hypothetical protein
MRRGKKKPITSDNIMDLSTSASKSIAGSLVLLSFAFALAISFVSPHLTTLTDTYFKYLALEQELEQEKLAYQDKRTEGGFFPYGLNQVALDELTLRVDKLEVVAHEPVNANTLLYPIKEDDHESDN